jgi:squalene synthase HpnC
LVINFRLFLKPVNPVASFRPSNVTHPAETAPQTVDHYENFPVATWLCPPHFRPAIAAIYWFARTGDDIADEGDAPPEQRLSALTRFRQDLLAIAAQQPHSGEWPKVFDPLLPVLKAFALPVPLLLQLLDAFEQDVRYTAAARRYQTDVELHDYCARSANPVGRLLLHLYGIHDEASLAQSDHVCTALQLINFWQDISVDVARDRWYPSVKSMQTFGVQDGDLRPASDSKKATKLVASYAESARANMLKGASLACRVPGRAGWELRLVVQGGLRILDKIEAMDFATWRSRPKLHWTDAPLLLWRAWRMSATRP